MIPELTVPIGNDHWIDGPYLTLFILDTGKQAPSEEPDEMHKATFHKGLHCLLR